MIVDFDDLHDRNHRLDLLNKLKEANPAFKCTVFAVPGLCSLEFLDSLPGWIEVAAHGWLHGGPDCSDPLEAANWSYEQTANVLNALPPRFVRVWKSPGWQISDGTYQALLDHGFAVADQPYNDHRRPTGLKCHRLGDGEHWHGHIQDVCGNGLSETFAQLLPLVSAAKSFEWISEVVA